MRINEGVPDNDGQPAAPQSTMGNNPNGRILHNGQWVTPEEYTRQTNVPVQVQGGQATVVQPTPKPAPTPTPIPAPGPVNPRPTLPAWSRIPDVNDTDYINQFQNRVVSQGPPITRAVIQENNDIVIQRFYENDPRTKDDDQFDVTRLAPGMARYDEAMNYARTHPETQYTVTDYLMLRDTGAANIVDSPIYKAMQQQQQIAQQAARQSSNSDIASKLRDQPVPIVSLSYVPGLVAQVAAVNPYTREEYDPNPDPWDVVAADWYGAPIPDARYDPREKVVEWSLPGKSLMDFTRVGFFVQNATGLDVYKMVNEGNIQVINPSEVYGPEIRNTGVDVRGIIDRNVSQQNGKITRAGIAGDFTVAGMTSLPGNSVTGRLDNTFNYGGFNATDIYGGLGLIGIGQGIQSFVQAQTSMIEGALKSIPVLGSPLSSGAGFVGMGVGAALGGLPVAAGVVVLSGYSLGEQIQQRSARGEPLVLGFTDWLGSGYNIISGNSGPGAIGAAGIMAQQQATRIAEDPWSGVGETLGMFALPAYAGVRLSARTGGAAYAVNPGFDTFLSGRGGVFESARSTMVNVGGKMDSFIPQSSAELVGVNGRGLLNNFGMDLKTAVLKTRYQEYGEVISAGSDTMRTADTISYRNPVPPDFSIAPGIPNEIVPIIERSLNMEPTELNRAYGGITQSQFTQIEPRMTSDIDVFGRSASSVAERAANMINTEYPGAATVEGTAVLYRGSKILDIHDPIAPFEEGTMIRLLPTIKRSQIFRTGQSYREGISSEDLTYGLMRKSQAVIEDTVNPGKNYRLGKDLYDYVQYSRELAMNTDTPGDRLMANVDKMLKQTLPYENEQGTVTPMRGYDIYELMKQKYARQPEMNEPLQVTVRRSPSSSSRASIIDNVISVSTIQNTYGRSFSAGNDKSPYNNDYGYYGISESIMPPSSPYVPPSSPYVPPYSPPYVPPSSPYSPPPSPPSTPPYVPPSPPSVYSPQYSPYVPPPPPPSQYMMYGGNSGSGDRSIIEQMNKLGRAYRIQVMAPLGFKPPRRPTTKRKSAKRKKR